MPFVLSVFGCIIVGWIGGLFSREAIPTWYQTLIKPAGVPPSWVFSVVWTLLYILMGISFALIWTSKRKKKNLAYAIFSLQLFLNFIWSYLFFYLHSPLLGLIDISLLWFVIIATLLVFGKISKPASYLLIPYLLWVTYAWKLNFLIWFEN